MAIQVKNFRFRETFLDRTFPLKEEFHVPAHGQTVTSAHLIPLLKQSKVLTQETETIP